MCGNYYILAYILIYIGVSNGLSEFVTDETRLHQDIFQKRPYIKDVRPVANQSDIVTVKFGLSLQSIDNLDAETGLLHTNCWLNMEWIDHQFAWKESDYGGVHSIRVNIDDIWVPDISPYNAQRFDYILKDKTAVVYSNGKVSWVPPILLSTSCTVDLWKYPYDKQTCFIKFGSETYVESQVNLTSRSDQVDVSTYSPSKSYKLLKATSKRHGFTYVCCPAKRYNVIEFVLQLKRRSTYSSHLFISPAVIISLLIPVIFILPPESNEKLTFGIGLLVTDAIVFMAMIDGLQIMGHMTIPLVGVYHIINMVLISISLVISAIVMNIWNKGERAKLLPTWINTVILAPLGKVLCVSKEDIIHQEAGIDLQRLQENETDDGPIMPCGQNANLALWRQLAIIIDRLCFLIFLAVIILSVIAFGSI